MQDTPPTPGEIIRILRESHSLSAAELGRRIGKSEATITAIERGERRATLPVCIDIARVLDVPVDRIVGQKIAAVIDPQPAEATL